MEKLIIEGGHPLKGNATISGAKNAALPLMAATILTPGVHKLHNIPKLNDIRTMKRLLTFIGAEIEGTNGSLNIDTEFLEIPEAPYEIVKTMRASAMALGPLLARFGMARVSLPGGCAIGARPINLHLKAFEAMGAEITIEEGYVKAVAKQLNGARIHFDTITVTGTENVMMAAVKAKGETIIENAAREPEIANLAEYLTSMGAKIEGAGTDTIHIQGVDTLTPGECTTIPDRIEAGTIMVAAAITGGDVVITNAIPSHLEAFISKLREIGCDIAVEGRKVWVRGDGKHRCVDITTAPFPGFATDLQAQFMALMCTGQGSSIITETIFENRFMHVGELVRLGANITVEGHTAIVKGIDGMKGAPLMATDLRASASLVLAGLAAEGSTEVRRIYHLDRGYELLDQKLNSLGAKITRVKDEEQ